MKFVLENLEYKKIGGPGIVVEIDESKLEKENIIKGSTSTEFGFLEV